MTVRHHLDLLAATFMVRALSPFHENLAKRQVKAPKVYLRDSGILHALLDVPDLHTLRGHPKVGASWEGFCIEALVHHLGAGQDRCFFWATHGGAELDLLVLAGRRRLGFEVKYTAAPHLTPSMRIAMSDLRLDTLDVIYPGTETYPLGPRVRAVAARRLIEDVQPLR